MYPSVGVFLSASLDRMNSVPLTAARARSLLSLGPPVKGINIRTLERRNMKKELNE